MHFAARAAGERERAEADQRKIAPRFIEIAPETERRHVADADDGIEITAADHPLAGGDEEVFERWILAKSGQRLGVNRHVEFSRKLANGSSVGWIKAAEDDDRT